MRNIKPKVTIPAIAHAADVSTATLGLLQRNPALLGLHDSAGDGAVDIVRTLREDRQYRGIVLVCHELTPAHRLGLVDGVVNLGIQTPLATLSDTTMRVLL